MNTVTIPKGIIEIGQYCFEYCTNLENIAIIASVIKIGTDIFICCDNLCIWGYKNSSIESYSKRNGLRFASID